MAEPLCRCDWAQVNDPLMRSYHDHEWGRPLHGSQRLFAMLSLEIFQCGLSWQLVLRRRQALFKDFENFDVQAVSAFDADHIDRLMADSAIIRNRGKIEATVANAALIARQFPGEAFDRYCWSFTGGLTINHDYPDDPSIPRYDHLSVIVCKDMRDQGLRFLGPVTVHSFLQAAGMINDHQHGCFLNGCGRPPLDAPAPAI